MGGRRNEKPRALVIEASRGRRFGGSPLLAQPEALDQRAIALDVAALQVIELAAALAHEPQQPAARMEILDVRLEMLREHVDALGEQRDLDLGGSGVALRALVLPENARLVCGGDGHWQMSP